MSHLKYFLQRWWPLLAVFVFTFLSAAYVMSHRGFSPANEARYIAIVDEMLASGNWFTLSLDGAMYTDKPPFFFQIIALLRLLLGGDCLLALYGISFLSACGIVWVMDKTFSASLGSATSVCGPLKRATLALAFMTAGLVMGQEMFLRMDLLMTLFIVGAIASFHKAYMVGGYSWWLPICIFMALYTKGPMGLAMPVATILVFLILRRDHKSLALHLGWRTWTVVGALSLVWLALAWYEGGWEYVESLVFGQISSRVFQGSVHNAPWYYYLWVLPLCIIPLTPLWLGAVLRPLGLMLGLRGPRVKPLEFPSAVLLMVTAVVCPLVILSATPSKLAIYVTPLIPFGAWLIAWLPLSQRLVGILFRITCCTPLLISIAVIVCLLAGERFTLLAPYGFFYLRPIGYVAAGVMLAVSACGAALAFSAGSASSAFSAGSCALNSGSASKPDRLWLSLLISLSSFWLILATASPLIDVFNTL